MYDEICDDHAALRRLMTDFAARMSHNFTEESRALIQDRLSFSRLYRAYLAHLDDAARLLPPPGSDPRVATALASIAIMPVITDTYSRHLREWSPQDIAANWGSYRLAVFMLQRRLLEQFDIQERSLLPLLQQRGSASGLRRPAVEPAQHLRIPLA